MVCGTQGQLQEAQALLLRAWPIYQAQLDPNHPSIKALLRWVDQVQQALESSRSS